MTIEERVRSTLHQAGSRINVDEAAPGDPVPGTAPRPPRRLSPLVAFAAGAVAVLLLGVSFFLSRGSETPPAQGPPPLEDGDPASIDWRALDVVPDDFNVQEIVDGPSGFIALATRFRGELGARGEVLLTSEDGVEWDELDTSGFTSAVAIDGLIGHDGGYLAHGLYAGADYSVTTRDRPSNFAEPAVWTSEDGIAWELTALPLPAPSDAISEVVSYSTTDAAVDEQGAVVIGIEFDEDLPEVEGEQIVPTRMVAWSRDGSGDWVSVDNGPLEAASALAQGPSGILAVAPGGDDIVTMVRGPDANWLEMGSIPSPDLLPILTGNSDGYLARTAEGIWLSPDGADWALTSSLGSIVTVGAGPGGMVVVTRAADGTAGMWWIRDLSDYAAVGAGDELAAGMDYVSGATVTDHALVVYGQSGSGRADNVTGFLLVGTGD